MLEVGTWQVCNVGPAMGTARETLSTLQFSQQARQVQNRPTLNEELLTPEVRADVVSASLECSTS